MTKLTARQFAVKAIHEDKLNVRNPSILAKLLKEYASLTVKHTKEGDAGSPDNYSMA